MSTAVWYPINRSAAAGQNIQNDARLILIAGGAKPKRPKLNQRRIKKMTPNGPAKLKIQKTVFDLSTFSNIILKKEVEPPAKPTTVTEALAAVGNDEKALIDLIYKGLESRARDNAYDDMSGFMVEDTEEGTVKPYEGKFADEGMEQKINAAVLSLAKLQGFEKSLPVEKKNELKESARSFLRANPAMLKNLAG